MTIGQGTSTEVKDWKYVRNGKDCHISSDGKIRFSHFQNLIFIFIRIFQIAEN